MNATHLHLLVNHFPVIGSIIGVLIMAAGLLLRNEMIKKTALVVFVGAGIFTGIAYKTGEESEHAIESVPGFSEYYLEEHEETAEGAAPFMYAMAAISLASLVLIHKKHKRAKISTYLSMTLGIITMILMIQVGNLGGKIRRPDIRDNNQTPIENPSSEHEEEH
ncbi:hypothetical protein QWY31_12760 [Cytophagales bacterium LB-30]|uniref:Uncharacterized protein n=1 Tax=Shiella aurantiaca TaxID=3058365 RepID=A0ABT8F810_9BACT|nr:hypothetical protein [Shiella aurantiaca]MDN4166374.1 hypothetical protein [Shiella aurantiaca]